MIAMLAGVICRKANIIDSKTVGSLSSILVKVTLPCLIFMSLQRPFTKELLSQGAAVCLISFVLHFAFAVTGLLLVKIFKVKANAKGVWIAACTFGNVGYMGFPIINAIFGQEALFFTSLINSVFNILCFTLGVVLINIGFDNSYAVKPSVLLRNPTIIATALGLCFFSLNISVPSIIAEGLQTLGNMTTPLSMIIVGAILAKNRMSDTLTDMSAYIVSLARLVAFPTATFFILRLFINDPIILGVFVILSGMPVAAITSILAAEYNTNFILASKLIFVSTILSLFTIPLISLFL